MENLISGMQYFRTNLLWQKRELFAECLWGQRPFAMLVGAPDSQLLSDALRQLAPRDLFVSRTVRTVAPGSGEIGDSVAAVEYAITRLGVTDLVVCGHSRRPLTGPSSALVPHLKILAAKGWHRYAAEAKAILDRYITAAEETGCEEVESTVLKELKRLAQQPTVARGIRSGTVRLHGWMICLESRQIYTQSPEHGRFVPLLEVPTIRGLAPQQPPCSVVVQTASARDRNLRRNAGYAAVSALSLAALAILDCGVDSGQPRIQGAPPACACLTQADNTITPCSEDCLQATSEDQSASLFAAAERTVAWR